MMSVCGWLSKNSVPERLPRRRRGADFEKRTENCRIRPRGKTVRAARGSDAGVALGAALAPYLDDNGKLRNSRCDTSIGTCFDDESVESALRTYNLRYTRLPIPASNRGETAFAGENSRLVSARMELAAAGARNRSILADPPIGNERQSQ